MSTIALLGSAPEGSTRTTALSVILVGPQQTKIIKQEMGSSNAKPMAMVRIRIIARQFDVGDIYFVYRFEV